MIKILSKADEVLYFEFACVAEKIYKKHVLFLCSFSANNYRMVKYFFKLMLKLVIFQVPINCIKMTIKCGIHLVVFNE